MNKANWSIAVLCMVVVMVLVLTCLFKVASIRTTSAEHESQDSVKTIAETTYEVLDIREFVETFSYESIYSVALILQDNTGDRTYYKYECTCSNPQEDTTYQTIASYIQGDTVEYMGNDIFQLCNKNNSDYKINLSKRSHQVKIVEIKQSFAAGKDKVFELTIEDEFGNHKTTNMNSDIFLQLANEALK